MSPFRITRQPRKRGFLVLASLLLAGFVSGCNWESAETTAQADDTQAEPEPKHTGKANRLADESSPYLLLHAHNPVDWYPWGPEAFEKAKKENKPIFLSIGYSSCYWCHVMERESFSNKKIAEFMNEHFVSIKVDREERPDVDDIYMTSCIVYFQLIGSPQGGGWPLSMFMTPEGKPFAGGTYFPPEDAKGRMGFLSVVKRVDELWKNQEAAIRQNADLLTTQVQRSLKTQAPTEAVSIDRKLVSSVIDALKASYDEEYGGVDFSELNPQKPKFPVPAKLALLQHEVRRQGDEQAAKILYHTLDEIAAGGIQDHLAGGFHRYSTDRAWHVPHFEKMLYDQAQLADVYIEAFRQTKNPNYSQVAQDILDYVLAELTERDTPAGPGGSFHSAMDAETDHIEGKYYVWEPAEIERILGADNARVFMEAYGMREENPFEHGFVLHLPRTLEETAKKLKMPPNELNSRLTKMRKQVLAERSKRPAPLKDDKVLTSWNGLMIRAFARAGDVLGRKDYLQHAQRAARFVLTRMRNDEGQLLHSYRKGKAKLNAYLDDYAFFVEGLLAIHQVTQDNEWLIAAQKLTDLQIRLFWDKEEQGFFFTAHDHEPLIARTKPAYDSVIPSGNSVSARNLLRLSVLTQNPEYRRRAHKILQLFTPMIGKAPRGMTNMALAASEFLEEPPAAPARTGAQLDLRNASESTIRLVSGAAEQPLDPKPKAANDAKVLGRAYLSVDRLPAGSRCRLLVLVRVADEWHINTNPAQPDYLVPTELTAKSKLGSRVKDIVYPSGKVLNVEGFDEPLTVFEGQVAVYATIEIPATAAGKTEEITLQVDYQACNDKRCLRPDKFILKGVIPVAAAGEEVKSINQKLFPK